MMFRKNLMVYRSDFKYGYFNRKDANRKKTQSKMHRSLNLKKQD